MKQIASERRFFGYRRFRVLLARKGIHLNLRRFRRICLEEKLQVKRGCLRKHDLGTQKPIDVPAAVNMHWSLNFASDAFTYGLQCSILAAVDQLTRER